MANLMRNRWLWLAVLGAALLFGLAAGKRLPGPTMVHAAGAGSVSFSPTSGGDSDAFYASAQDGGSGTFKFASSDWLSPLYSGTWTVRATGESSRTVVTVTFSIA